MKITGAVIAGGKSKRMGFDKLSILFQQKTFLQRATDLLEHFTDQIFINSNQDISSRYPILKDEIKDIGPMGGIYSMLKQIKTAQVLIVPADMPLLNTEVLEYLMQHYQKDKLINVFQTKNKTQMLVGIYDKKLLPVLEKQIENKNYKLRILLQKSAVNLIDGNKFESLFANINTTEDLKTIQQQHEN